MCPLYYACIDLRPIFGILESTVVSSHCISTNFTYKLKPFVVGSLMVHAFNLEVIHK